MNLFKFVIEHQCVVDCEYDCMERENCLSLQTEAMGIDEYLIYDAKFLHAVGVKIGENKFHENPKLDFHRDYTLRAVKRLCDAKQISASVSYIDINIHNTDHPTGYYATVMYDCTIDEDNNVIFDGGKVVPCFSEQAAVDYALTSKER
jgi:hypothetical protein